MKNIFRHLAGVLGFVVLLAASQAFTSSAADQGGPPNYLKDTQDEMRKNLAPINEYNNANLNSQIAWLRCREEMDDGFLFHALNSPAIQAHFQSSKYGAALQQFTIRQIKELRIPIPPTPEQKPSSAN